MNYTKQVMDHFANPRNVGTLDDADGVGEVGNPTCGDMMTFYIKIKEDILVDVKFQTFGCGAAIAVSSMISEMAKGKSVDAAYSITNKDVAEQLGGLPGNKMHCSNLGADALRRAIENYRGENTEEHEEHHEPHCAKKEDDNCPYCGSENDDDHVAGCSLKKKE